MATESPNLHDGTQTTAAADLSTKQFYLVKLSAARAVNIVAGITDIPYGVLQNKPKSGEAADVVFLGVSKLIAGATIAAGVSLQPNASGQAITRVTGAGTTLIGYSLEAAVVNQVFTAMIIVVPWLTS